MLKKILIFASYIFIPIPILVFGLKSYENFLDSQISKGYNSAIGRTYGINELSKGISLLKRSAINEDVIIFGSSELDGADYISQNPVNMFPNNYLNSNVSLVGRAGTQSLLDAIKIGALSEDLRDKKIVFIVSPQWFFDKEIRRDYFSSNFSEIQFYKFLENNLISNKTKEYVCKRISNLLEDESNLSIPCFYSNVYSRKNLIDNFIFYLFKPYFIIREKILNLKDKHMSYKIIKKFENEKIQTSKEINWEDEMINAEKLGKLECTNNNFFVYDDYFNKYISPNILNIKGSCCNINPFGSDEMTDYIETLKVFNQLNIKPYIVITSMNGYFYDYVGLSKEKRYELYNKLDETARNYGLDILNLKGYEYEPYFYKDVMHLGWKGWTVINEKISKHFS